MPRKAQPWFRFYVEAVHDTPDDPRHSVAVQLQQLEWRVLFEHGTRAAVVAVR